MRTNRTAKLDLRLTAAAKQTLQRAADVKNETVTDFVLQSALNEANTVLAERQVFSLDAEQWSAFQAALDAPPKARPRLARLLKEPSILD